MVTAVILLNVERTHIKTVAGMLADLPEISEVFSVAGKFDLVAIVRVPAHEALADLVTDRMSDLPGIVHSETLIAFRAYSKHDVEAGFSLGGNR